MYGNVRECKELKRNEARKSGIMKVIYSFTGMLKRSSEINHDCGKKKMNNFTDWVEGTADGVTELIFAEENYTAQDKFEKDMAELKERENND